MPDIAKGGMIFIRDSTSLPPTDLEITRQKNQKNFRP
jgi:hypothetical protein